MCRCYRLSQRKTIIEGHFDTHVTKFSASDLVHRAVPHSSSSVELDPTIASSCSQRLRNASRMTLTLLFYQSGPPNR